MGRRHLSGAGLCIAALGILTLAAPARPVLGFGRGPAWCRGDFEEESASLAPAFAPSAAVERLDRREIVLDIDASTDARRVLAALRARGLVSGLRRGLVRIELPDRAQTRSAAAFSRFLPGVRRAEPNLETSFCEGQQSTIPALGDDEWERGAFERQPAFALLGRVLGTVGATGEGVVVAVVDTGVLATHEVFAGRLAARQHDFLDGDSRPDEEWNGIDDDGDGFVDEAKGHGTFVAGLVAALAPGAAIMPLRVLDDEGLGTSFDLADAIYFAVDAGANVINLSLALEESSEVVADAIAYAEAEGVTVVAAAGNIGRAGEGLAFPASLPGVVAVTSVTFWDRKPVFAAYDVGVALAAPGVRILGPYPGGSDRSYAQWTGTSFSAPMVAAAAALLLEEDPGARPDEVRERLRAAVDDLDRRNPDFAGRLGTGRLDFGRLGGR